jgi:hypothetical protein
MITEEQDGDGASVRRPALLEAGGNDRQRQAPVP